MSEIKVLIVDDEQGQRDLLAGYLSGKGFMVTAAANGEEALAAYERVFAPVALLDMKMPGMDGIELLGRLKELNPYLQAIVLTAFGSVETAVAAIKAGACDYLTKPIEDLDELLLKLRRAAEQNRLVVSNQLLRERLEDVFPTTEIVGESPAIKEVLKLVGLVAPRDTTVLITGPSGTGKELVARAIHSLSDRSAKPLVTVNCAAFPETLLESELFGHEKGAFTGADQARQGRFELADGGTLLLDEVGEMPLSMQVKLLRAIEEKTVQRLGSTTPVTLDLRILAATNRDLEQMVKEGSFRQDLYYRLNIMRIDLPALSERKADILLLAQTFIDRFNHKTGRQLTGLEPGAARLLTSYDWPGNVRELENVIERAAILTSGDSITTETLGGLDFGDESTPAPELMPMSEVEKRHIKFCLDQMDWNLAATAEVLGIHRNTLRSKIKDYGLSED
ncbi:response regulator [candidate division GN15 bacterium]|nr:response regulator [candidate division GN15 bacterium]